MRIITTLSALMPGLMFSLGANAYPGDEMYATPGRLVDVDDRHINLYCSGSGPPTIVLESGLGGRASTWAQVQPALSTRAAVCSYDRAGYGFSDLGPEPRTSDHLAEDLHAALSDAHVVGPYILVATAFGAFNVRLFANKYAHDVAGMVLLNPSPEDEELVPAAPTIERIDNEGLTHARNCGDAARAGKLFAASPERASCVPAQNPRLSPTLNAARLAQLEKPNAWSALAAEWSVIRESAAMVAEARKVPIAVPLIVVSEGSAPAFDEFSGRDKMALSAAWTHWSAWQDDIAALSRDSEHIRTAGSGRAVETDDPALVVAAVEKVLSAVANRQPLRALPPVER